MLLDVTALLATSANLTGVVEAFDVPGNSPIATVASHTLTTAQVAFQASLDQVAAAPVVASAGSVVAPVTRSVTPVSTAITAASSVPVALPAAGPDPVVGPQPDGIDAPAAVTRAPITRLPAMSGMPLLQQLGLLDRSTLARYASGHAAQLAALVAHQPAAAEVQSWWSGLPGAQRSAMAADAPSLVGNLEGLPYGVRNAANRLSLSRAEAAIRTQLDAGVGRATADELEHRLHMLAQVRTSLTPGSSHIPRTLVALDPTGAGTAVIMIGDATTADYVDYVIPGMFSSIDGQLVGFTTGTDRIVSDQQAWLKRLQPDDTPTVAAVAWIGYHTPNLANVASLDLAEQGQASLTASIQGLRAVREGHQPYLSVLAHSYGSTTAMIALQRNDISVDALAVFGSPGAPATSVDELHVTGGNVWVGAAQW
ncbi:MAG TPA: alpha/beta hydrolase, partial [Pseudolysinimonas sp.]|nr:alpha/beta hydrolase [Pseudolysinimonas sp.]